jgi:hypothetical protein
MTAKKRQSRIFAIIFFLQMYIYDCDIMIWIKISLSVAGYQLFSLRARARKALSSFKRKLFTSNELIDIVRI